MRRRASIPNRSGRGERQDVLRRTGVLLVGILLACGVAGAVAGSGSPEANNAAWDRPRFDERWVERDGLAHYLRAVGIDDDEVLAAIGHVPRHCFVPAAYQAAAYDDTPLPIGYGQTISQPYIVALMTEALAIQSTSRVLEIGTGSGYQAAILAELTPFVYTIEIIEELAEAVDERFESLGYRTIRRTIGDGYYGWAEHAPFDGIIVTCAAGHVPPPLIEQLEPGGRMIIPVGGIYQVQYLVLVTKDEDRIIRSERLLPVRFVPMTGRALEGE